MKSVKRVPGLTNIAGLQVIERGYLRSPQGSRHPHNARMLL